jgi:hypothetical protein
MSLSLYVLLKFEVVTLFADSAFPLYDYAWRSSLPPAINSTKIIVNSFLGVAQMAMPHPSPASSSADRTPSVASPSG